MSTSFYSSAWREEKMIVQINPERRSKATESKDLLTFKCGRMCKINDYSLYLVISEECAFGRRSESIASEAISGGVDIIQMREKNKTRKELLTLGAALSNLCKESNKLFIVNDNAYIAKEVEAAGVHLGQEDIQKFSISSTRKIIGTKAIIGLSTHCFKQFEEANNNEKINYIAFGPVFPTKTKNYFIGTKEIEKVLEKAVKPVFFIGGINLSNTDGLLNLGAKNIALIRGILEAKNIKAQSAAFKKKLEQRSIFYGYKNKR